jgi:rare lipoprotein A
MQKKHINILSRLVLAISLIVPAFPLNALARHSGTVTRSVSQKNNSSRSTGHNVQRQATENFAAKHLPGGDRFMVAVGRASFYASKFHGKQTASGETFNKKEFTAAHRSLPFGTIVRVTNLDNGKMVFVKINDRGPYIKNRIIDLSKAAAKQLDLVDNGIGKVKIEVYN